MRLSRLYCPKPLQSGERITLDEMQAHYLQTVLRLRAGSDLVLFNGENGEYRARLCEVSRKQVSVEIGAFIAADRESPLAVELGLGLARSDRVDFALQKAVELGVRAMTPLQCERSVVRLAPTQIAGKTEHWRKILQHAAAQCGRCRLPHLYELATLPQWLARCTGLRVLLDPDATMPLTDLPAPSQGVTLLIGPEGGFSPSERAMIIASGFVPVRLGARIMRAETAVVAALAAVQTLWGDLGR